jgi:hypothetical protein
MVNNNIIQEEQYIREYKKLKRDDIIEYFLGFLESDLQYNQEPNDEDERKLLFLFNLYRENIMEVFISEGLIKAHSIQFHGENITQYKPMPKLIEAIRVGGWKNYLTEIQEEKNRRKKIDNLTINNHTIQWIIAAITIFIISINCFFDYQSLQLNKSSNKDKEVINEVKELRKALLIQNNQIECIIENNKPTKKVTRQVH